MNQKWKHQSLAVRNEFKRLEDKIEELEKANSLLSLELAYTTHDSKTCTCDCCIICFGETQREKENNKGNFLTSKF